MREENCLPPSRLLNLVLKPGNLGIPQERVTTASPGGIMVVVGGVDGHELPVLIAQAEVAGWLTQLVDQVVVCDAARVHIVIAGKRIGDCLIRAKAQDLLPR